MDLRAARRGGAPGSRGVARGGGAARRAGAPATGQHQRRRSAVLWRDGRRHRRRAHVLDAHRRRGCVRRGRRRAGARRRRPRAGRCPPGWGARRRARADRRLAARCRPDGIPDGFAGRARLPRLHLRHHGRAQGGAARAPLRVGTTAHVCRVARGRSGRHAAARGGLQLDLHPRGGAHRSLGQRRNRGDLQRSEGSVGVGAPDRAVQRNDFRCRARCLSPIAGPPRRRRGRSGDPAAWAHGG